MPNIRTKIPRNRTTTPQPYLLRQYDQLEYALFRKELASLIRNELRANGKAIQTVAAATGVGPKTAHRRIDSVDLKLSQLIQIAATMNLSIEIGFCPSRITKQNLLTIKGENPCTSI
jgi:hypothetical protein